MDTETNLEAEAPEVEETEIEEQAATETDETDSPEGEPDEPEEDSDLVEIERNGQTFKVPAALKDEFLMQGDYTRKTQELAEQRKALEARLTQYNETSEAEQKALVNIGVIDAQLADYETIDWDAWEQTDPQASQRAWRQYQTLQQQRQGVVMQYAQAQQQRTLVQQQETAKLMEQGQRELAARIPGWGQEKATALQSHAVESYGFTPQELATVVDPRMIQVLHDAYQFRQTSKTQQTAKRVEAQQSVKPAVKVSGGKPPVKPLSDKASTEEWMKARNKQAASS